MSPILNSVRIVLVEPAGPLNIGSVARVMKNMGLRQLVLVKPQCDPVGDDARRMAVHAADILEAAQQVDSLPEALSGCNRAIATTARDRSTVTLTLEHPRQALPWLLDPTAASSGSAALIFGPEDRGLNNTELSYAQRWVRIPSSELYPSLNLAQAVAICCYELSAIAAQMAQAPLEAAVDPAQLTPSAIHTHDLAPLDALENYYQELERLLLNIGYLYPHTADSRMKKLRQLLNRAYPSSNEVAMLRGMISQVEWALKQAQVKPTAVDFPKEG